MPPGRAKGRVWGRELLKRPGFPGCDPLNLYLFQVDMSRRALGGDPAGSHMSDGKNVAQASRSNVRRYMDWPAGSVEASSGHVHHKFHCMGMELWHSSVFERSSKALGCRNVDCPVQWHGMAAGSFSGLPVHCMVGGTDKENRFSLENCPEFGMIPSSYCPIII